MRLKYYKRKAFKNEFDDLRFLFDVAGFEPSAIIDGGANIGFVTFQFSKRFPNSAVYAIEPNPEVFAKLKSTYEGNPNVCALNVGIARESGKLTFNVNVNTGTSSFLKPTRYHGTHQAKRIKEAIEIETISIIDLASRNGLEHIGILKLDIEGFELEALKGADTLLKDQKIHSIVLEANLIESYQGQSLFHEVTRYLAECGYYPFNVYGLHETPIRQSVFFNFLFLSSQFRERLKSNFGDNCGW